MASLPLTVAKIKPLGYLLCVSKDITALRDVCDDLEKRDRVPAATARLEEGCRKYEEPRQDVLELVAEDQVGDELGIYGEIEDIYKQPSIKQIRSARKARILGKQRRKTARTKTRV